MQESNLVLNAGLDILKVLFRFLIHRHVMIKTMALPLVEIHVLSIMVEKKYMY